MSLKRRNKVLDTEIVKLCFKLEIITYKLMDLWKKRYKYTLTESFRRQVENLRESTVCALRYDKTYVQQKKDFYNLANSSLDNIEYMLEMMVSNELQIITNKQYAEIAEIVDEIGNMVDRLAHSLDKKQAENNVSEPQSCDNAGD